MYRARPRGGSPSDDVYAVKLLMADTERGDVARRMLQREAVLGRRIADPHVVSVLACQTSSDPAYLVMPYLAGATLREVLDAGHRVPLAHGLWIVRQIAQGLDALHAHGWRHADIKPANIHIAAGGHATLLDLGMAQRLDEPGSVTNRPLAGTLRYTAPECFVSNSRAGVSSDLYSLGVVFYELLAGRPPFTADDPAHLAAAHLEQPPTPLRNFAPTCHRASASLPAACWRKTRCAVPPPPANSSKPSAARKSPPSPKNSPRRLRRAPRAVRRVAVGKLLPELNGVERPLTTG